jgi:hypothetical protein
MNKYLPSKKFAKFIGIIILVALVIWVVSRVAFKRQLFAAKGASARSSAEGASVNLYEQDSDDDGVYDWEEALWGTDPQVADTNKDGVSDDKEIAAKKKEIQAKNDLEGGADVGTDRPNQTESFARQLLSTASLAEQQGGLTAESMENFSKSLGTSIANANIPDQFTLTDIKLSAVDNAVYKAALAQAFSEYRTANISELGTFSRFAGGDSTALADLDRLVNIYAKLSKDILAMPAPYAVAGTHLVMANTTFKLSIVFQSMKSLADDPLVAVTGFKEYQEYSTELQQAIVRLTAYFSASGV